MADKRADQLKEITERLEQGRKGYFYFGNVYEVPAYNVEIPQLQLQ